MPQKITADLQPEPGADLGAGPEPGADPESEPEREPGPEREPVFRAAAFGIVRMAALPVTHPSAARTLTSYDDGPHDVSRTQGTPRVRDHLLALVEDPVVREAIEVSSASLAATLAKAEDGAPVPDAKLRRATLAVTRYVLRMTGRPTPFGLLAGVHTARLGGETSVRTGSLHRKHARPDAAWLDEIVRGLHHDGEAREALLVVVNNLCAVRGDRLVLPYVRAARGASSSEPVPHEMTVGYSPVVRAAVEAARRPLSFAALRGAVQDSFPEAGREDVERLLVGLLDREVLLTDAGARQDRPDQLAYVNSRLSGTTSATAAGLRRVAGLLGSYAEAAPGAGRDTWRAALSAMREVRATSAATSATTGAATFRATGTEAAGGAGDDGAHPPIHVDLRVDSDVRLPYAVADEVTRAAGVLWRLAPAEGQYAHLTEYHRAFLDRYGTDRPVLVREVLDPHLGLGAPAGYRVPSSDRGPSDPESAMPYSSARDEALGQAVHEVLTAGTGAELVLDERLLAQLAPEQSGAALPPGSLDLCVQPLARSAAALAAGDFRLVVANGSYSAGAMAGRFAHLIDAERDLAALHSEADRGSGRGPGGPVDGPGGPVDGPGGPGGPGPEAPLPVQLFFQPRGARSNNVARVPRLAAHAVCVGCFPDPEDTPEHGIGLDDVAVGATGERLFLVRASTGREISVLRPSMLNITTEAPNTARFLAGVGMSGLRPWAPWQWSRLDALPCLPRVRHGRTVLSPARWRPPPELRDRRLDEKDWLRALERWRGRYAVPDVLRVSVLDHHLDLDLTAPAHQQLLRTQLVGRSVPLVQESPLADPAELGWSGGYATEVVVPLVPVRPRPAAPRAPRAAASRVRHAPGGEWLYAKVYAARDRLDTLLVRELPPLLARVEGDVDRWFFLRYADPGAHLRLRLHGEPGAIRERVLPALHEWAASAAAEGAIRKLVLDTYEPETDRYGGPAALTPAERLFHADSRLVTAQLAARARGQLPVPPETLAALNHAALLDALGDWDWWSWVLAAYPAELENEIPAVRRRAATKLALSFDNGSVADTGSGTGSAGGGTGSAGGGTGSAGGELAVHRAELTRAAREYGRALGLGSGLVPSPERGSAVAGVLHMHANRLLGMDPGAERHSYGLLRSVVRARAGRAEHT
ncbi:thiopeptide-type bacteriocin biosynthesis protein [Streptomyces sp. NBC_01775]|uniref:thiopeptide-type bacteriocin biosynthesis protein n=1 Tax=Streptomyces sp. NBC_01775 TaxID=2975939 RepID=UPI002DDABBC5|nr:thiopeptide-type bacteriocin biosynthesis protein [Streptomyces sp. NBC_01775]WSB80409.1 thiopeptide-type bacteriocin biosynthesis protein [Streptomyces sp. NBC_01775]